MIPIKHSDFSDIVTVYYLNHVQYDNPRIDYEAVYGSVTASNPVYTMRDVCYAKFRYDDKIPIDYRQSVSRLYNSQDPESKDLAWALIDKCYDSNI